MHNLYFCFMIIVIALTAACTSEDKSGKSPLTTWDPSHSDTFTDSSVGNGTLEITDNCVRLILENKKTILLIWPEPTSWNETSQTIEFVDVQGNQLTLHNGDQIMPGGSTPTVDPPYVLPPDPSCKADESFVLNAVRIID